MWKKNGRPLRNINRLCRREEGQVSMCVGLFFLIYITVLLYTLFLLEEYRIGSLYLEDALAASNLASAVVDLKEYGYSHFVCLKDPTEAFERYESALKNNLSLRDDGVSSKFSVITGSVRCESYIVYNVRGNQVETMTRQADGSWKTEYGRLGEAMAPNGVLVERTGIYSEISFPVKGLFGMEMEARKGKLVDIVGEG